jgi:RHS repeat-associated protein
MKPFCNFYINTTFFENLTCEFCSKNARSYLVYGKEFTNKKSTTYEAIYKFSGKERDIETGYGYFGARYFSSELGIWISTDPMANKYPSLTPYNYCADNPIMLHDPNGEDFDPRIDHKNKTITICATYYTASENRDKLQKGLAAWNKQSGEYYFTPDGTKTEYKINFDLKVADGDFATTDDAGAAFKNDKSGFANYYNVLAPESGNRGECDGNQILVSPDAPSRTTAHEIGHTIGIGHFKIGLMETGGDGNKISIGNVANTLKTAGFGVKIPDSVRNPQIDDNKVGKPTTVFDIKGSVDYK